MKKDIIAAPIVKWAGGKSRLLSQIGSHFPSEPKKFYVEPFVGGGAILFWMLNNYGSFFEHVIANDYNGDLINMYKTVQTDVNGLIKELEKLQQGMRNASDGAEDYYLRRRAEYNDKKCTDIVRRSALLIFLNKTCFNGLYRVNKNGEFNVPFGKRKDITIFSADLLRKDHEVLQGVEFTVGDYSNAVAPGFQDKAFYYFDPPYRPLTSSSSFTKYTKDSFGEEQQIQLAKHCRELDDAGAFIMVSNADTEAVNPGDDFYQKNFPSPHFHIHRVMAHRFVNANPQKRGQISEVLITNYVPQGRHKTGARRRRFDGNLKAIGGI